MPYKKNPPHTRAFSRPLQRFHIIRTVAFVVLAASLLLINGSVTSSQKPPEPRPPHAVLAYATDISIHNLLAATNQARAAQGLKAFTLHDKLNSGAQAKAQDMIAKNYWSHTSPDGTEPWQFFIGSNYSYKKAGENLAYGFTTSEQVVDAWMNSAGHRANVLGQYVDVGFGIASGTDYQGTENTVVVAFYAVQQLPAAPKPAEQPPAATPSAPEPAPAASPPPEPPKTEIPSPQPNEPQSGAQPVATAPHDAKKVTNFEALLDGNANWAIYASLGMVGLTTLGFAGTHVQLIRAGWRRSEHFIFIHPALDAAVIGAVVAVILTSSAGFIR